MMRALASFVMRGRVQAAAFALLATAVPFCSFLGAAAVALVTLRKGAAQGLLVALWALLPALLWASQGQPLAMLGLLLMLPMALCLRRTASWSWTLVSMTLAGLAVGWYLASAYIPRAEEIVSVFQQLYGTRLDALLAGQGKLSQTGIDTLILTSFIRSIVSLVCFNALVALLLARAAQALLYNPGGLRAEMDSLRLPPVVAFALLGLSTLTYGQEASALCAAVQPALFAPLLVSGTALVHALSRRAGKLSTACLTLHYILLPVSYPGILALSCLDSLVDFRARLWRKASG